MFRDALRADIQDAITRAMDTGALPAGEIPEIEVEIPRDRRFGDYATNAAMVLARSTGQPPREIAQRLIETWAPPSNRIENLEVAGPGFINIGLAWPWRRELVRLIREQGRAYGVQTLGTGTRVNVEYVSANPTGPLHIGTGRNAVVGDVLANLLETLGHEVSREYYINDSGQQVLSLAKSVEHHYFASFGQSKPFPEDGYRGDYVVDIARKVIATDGDRWLRASEDERLAHFRDIAVGAVVADIRDVLERFGVRFDTWFSERTLVDSDAVDRVLADLQGRGYIYEQEGRLWFRSTSFGDDRDRVIFRPAGGWTYFGSDIAYHLNKLARGFDLMIDVWGIDHIGDVARVKGGLQALGVGEDRLEILIHQHVRLKNEGELLRMSKRSGEFVTLRELIDGVGSDAARYFYAMTSYTVPMDFDIALALRHSQENPVYYVQYAHARIAGILREAGLVREVAGGSGSGPREGRGAEVTGNGNAADRKVSLPEPAPLDRLDHEREAALIHILAELPEVIRSAGLRREPHRLCAYAREVAEAFHLFYTHCRVLGDDPDLTAARLALVDATRTVLQRVLGLVGVSAPERM